LIEGFSLHDAFSVRSKLPNKKAAPLTKLHMSSAPVASDPAFTSSVVECFRAMKAANPLIMCVTNRVTPQRMADVLLAAGASPAMIDNPEEVGQFASLADAINGGVYLNTGLHASQMGALDALADWRKTSPDGVLVVDPVGFGATKFRSASIRSACEVLRPEVIKGNAAEVTGMAGLQGDGKGVDAGSTKPADCVEAARVAGAAFGSKVVAITGPSDVIVECPPAAGTGANQARGRVATVRDGDGGPHDRGKMLTLVTGTGCSLGALMAATLAANPKDPFAACCAASAAFTLAGKRALASPDAVRGPGSLSAALLDELYLLDPEHLREVDIALEEA